MSMWNRTFEADAGTGDGSLDDVRTTSGTGDAAEKPSQPSPDVVSIGKLVCIKGELTGSEDMTVEGQFEGRIDLNDQVLTIGPNARVEAEVYAKVVIVLGKVIGNIKAADLVAIRSAGWVEGDIVAPRFAMTAGAHFNGRIVMQRAREATVESTQSDRPTPAPGPAPVPEADSVEAPEVDSLAASAGVSEDTLEMPSAAS